MKQKMKKFLLSVLLCVTFGLIVPLTALAADVSNPEEADFVLKMSRQSLQYRMRKYGIKVEEL